MEQGLLSEVGTRYITHPLAWLISKKRIIPLKLESQIFYGTKPTCPKFSKCYVNSFRNLELNTFVRKKIKTVIYFLGTHNNRTHFMT